MDTPSISLLNYGEKNTNKGEAVFAALIFKVMQFFGGTWNEAQIADCAKVCFDEWYYLTFAELAHFAQKAKSGGFKEEGKQLLYGQFSPANLIDWFVTYTSENMRERGEYFGKQKTAWVEPENPVPYEKFGETVEELARQLTEERDAEEAKRTKDILDYHNKMQNILDQRQKQTT